MYGNKYWINKDSETSLNIRKDNSEIAWFLIYAFEKNAKKSQAYCIQWKELTFYEKDEDQ